MGDIILWIPKLIIFLVALFSVGLIISQYGTSEVDTKDLEFNVLFNRVIYSKNCLLYENERVYPGIINMDRFNELILKECFNNDNQGIKFSLGDKEIFVNKDVYDSKPLCGTSGKQGFTCKSKQFLVLIKDKDSIKPKFLNMDIVKKNE